MKLNKYILPIALAVSALSFSSCNDFLDRHPQGQFTEDDNPARKIRKKEVRRATVPIRLPCTMISSTIPITD